MKIYSFILFVVVCCQSYLNTFGQSYSKYGSLSVKRITPDEGLSQCSNYFRFEDSQGFMWITAIDAMNRYDGRVIKVYNQQRYFKDCSPLQQGYGFAEDDQHNIYIGSEKGLYIYHRNKDQFTVANIFKGTDKTAMPICFVQGKIWCFNKQWQLVSYDVQTKEVVQLTTLNLAPITSLSIYASAEIFYLRYPFLDHQHKIWFMSKNNVAVYNISTKQITYPFADYLEKHKTLFSNSYYDSTQQCILFGVQNGMLHYSLQDEKLTLVTHLANQELGRFPQIIQHNKLLVCRKLNGDFFIYDQQICKIILIANRTNLWYQGTYQYSFDRSGQFWASDDGKGQIIFNFQPKHLPKEPSEITTSQLQIEGGVANFVELPDATILTCYKATFNPQFGFSQSPVQFKGYEYYNKVADTFRHGLWFFVERPNKIGDTLLFFMPYPKGPKEVVLMKSEMKGQLKDMQVIGEGKVLCAMPQGLSWLNIQTKTFEQIPQVADRNPFKINVLSGSRVAVSYINDHIRLLQLTKEGIRQVKDILPGIQSFYMQEDIKRNRFWVGTNQGIYLLNSTWQTIKHFDASNGLVGTNIFGLLLDEEGNAWCSHQHGISSIDANTYHVVNYDKEDGVQDWDFNNRAYFKATDGTLYFGGVSGFNYFKPPLKQQTFYTSSVYIDDIEINQEKWMPDTNADLIQVLNLKSHQHTISLQPLIRNLSDHSTQLVYKLKHVDTSWKFLPLQSRLMFNHLAAGNYTLELGLYNKYRNQFELKKTIQINIATPFYQTGWFIFSIILLSQLIFFTWFYKKKQKQQLIKQEKELASVQLASLEQQAFTSLMNPHFMFNALNSIQHYINVQDRQSANKYLSDFASLIRKNFESAQHSFIQLEEELENIQVYLRLEKMRFKSKFDFEIRVAPEVDEEAWMIPSMLLQPLVENALIHGILPSLTTGILKMHVSLHDNELKIEIIDNGIGLVNSHQRKLNDSHKSRGMELIQKRLLALSRFSTTDIVLHHEIPFEGATNPGHQVILNIPKDLYDTWIKSKQADTK